MGKRKGILYTVLAGIGLLLFIVCCELTVGYSNQLWFWLGVAILVGAVLYGVKASNY